MSATQAWIYLLLAGLCEIGWALGMKYSEGFSRLGISALTVAGMVASVLLLDLSLKVLPLGTAYAVWTGIGAVGTAAMGIWLFDEPSDAVRLGCIALIVIGIVGLKLVSSSSH